MTQRQSRVSIQPKTNCVSEVVAMVRQLGAEAWVGFNDGNVNYMAEAKRLAPGIPVFWDRAESDIAADIRIAKQHGFETLVLNERAVTPQKVAQLKQAGLGVGVWTVDDPMAWERFLAMGVERIYTDHPRRLLAFKAGQAFRDTACEGAYKFHLQGICTDERSAIYWSWTDGTGEDRLAGTRTQTGASGPPLWRLVLPRREGFCGGELRQVQQTCGQRGLMGLRL